MKNDFSSNRSEPREMEDSTIDLVSTSQKTAIAPPIILKKTDLIQTKFKPILVDHEKKPSRCVKGELIYERKSKKAGGFPTEKLTRQSIKASEAMGISLDTEETYNLFQGLKSLYDLYECIEEIPIGETSYIEVDKTFKHIHSILQSDPSALKWLAQENNIELVEILMEIITRPSSRNPLRSSLKKLAQQNVNVLTDTLNIERLERIHKYLEDNIDVANEEFWHDVFKENQWILSQIFSCPYTLFESKAYVGGKGISNSGGNICDFIYQNNLTQNVALIEIKTPCTSLIGSKYRNTYSLSSDASGAINQILHYRDTLIKQYLMMNKGSSKERFEVLSPKGFLIIGKTSGLDEERIAVLENYRNSLTNITIITYDELIKRIKDMMVILMQ